MYLSINQSTNTSLRNVSINQSINLSIGQLIESYFYCYFIYALLFSCSPRNSMPTSLHHGIPNAGCELPQLHPIMEYITLDVNLTYLRTHRWKYRLPWLVNRLHMDIDDNALLSAIDVAFMSFNPSNRHLHYSSAPRHFFFYSSSRLSIILF